MDVSVAMRVVGQFHESKEGRVSLCVCVCQCVFVCSCTTHLLSIIFFKHCLLKLSVTEQLPAEVVCQYHCSQTHVEHWIGARK